MFLFLWIQRKYETPQIQSTSQLYIQSGQAPNQPVETRGRGQKSGEFHPKGHRAGRARRRGQPGEAGCGQDTAPTPPESPARYIRPDDRFHPACRWKGR